MPRRLSKEAAIHLTKAKESAVAAVDCYNRCGTKFRSGSYIVLMGIAWTSLFHAVFFRRKEKPFYRNKQYPNRFLLIDGDFKSWELSTCIDKYFSGQNNGVSENLRFFIGLRNKIEHRSMPELDNHIFGECQANLFNFEDMLFKEFGTDHCLSECLSLAIQFSMLRNDQQGKAISTLHQPLRADLKQFIDTFRSSLSPDITADPHYSYKIFLIPKVANSPGQAEYAVEFVKYDPSKPAEMEQYEKLTTLIKPSVSQVVNAGRYKAGDVCKRVDPVVKVACGNHRCFNASYHHALACEFYRIRPKKGDPHPDKTNVDMCHYDAAHKDYVFTEKWVIFLVEEMKKPGQYEKILEWRRTGKNTKS